MSIGVPNSVEAHSIDVQQRAAATTMKVFGPSIKLDGSGSIGAQRIRAGLTARGLDRTNKEAKRAMRMNVVDVNKDGSVSMPEKSLWIKDLRAIGKTGRGFMPGD